jgi:hypothetical protein
MPTPKKNPLDDVAYLLEKANLLLNKKPRKKVKCKKCNEEKPIQAAGKCKECFYADRKPKESTAEEGKTWESTDGYMKIYVIEDDKLVVKNLHRHIVSQFLGRPLMKSERVIFKDNDKSNCAIENLKLISDTGFDFFTHCPHCGVHLQTPSIPSD